MIIEMSVLVGAIMSAPMYRQRPQPQAPKACAVASVVECHNVLHQEKFDHQALWNEYCAGCDGSEMNRALRFLRGKGINAYKTNQPKTPFVLAYNFAHDGELFTERSRVRGIRHAACVVSETVLNGEEYWIARTTRKNHGFRGHYFINKKVTSDFYNLK